MFFCFIYPCKPLPTISLLLMDRESWQYVSGSFFQTLTFPSSALSFSSLFLGSSPSQNSHFSLQRHHFFLLLWNYLFHHYLTHLQIFVTVAMIFGFIPSIWQEALLDADLLISRQTLHFLLRPFTAQIPL